MRSLLAVLLLLSSLAPGAPLISEIMYHPPHQDGREEAREEWIEIYNPGHNAVDLTNWTLSGAGFTFPNISIGSKEYLVLAAHPASFRRLYPEVDAVIGGWNGHLSNRGEKLVLRDDLGEEIDEVAYSDEGDWANRRPGPEGEGWIWKSSANGEGHSLELRNLTFTNASGLNWSESARAGGTPGAPNSVRSLNDAPLIQDVRHHPAVPGPNDLVMIQARLTDDLSRASGIVHHRISIETPNEFGQTPMRDDGREGDPIANDGVFTALLPVQPVGTVVEFYIEAHDRFHRRTWPNPSGDQGEQKANLLYQVDSESHREREPLYRLILSSEDSENLSSEDIPAGAHFNATLIAQTGDQLTTIYRCGVACPHPSTDAFPQDLLVFLPGLETWNNHRELHLSSQFSFNQLLTSLIYREAGLPIPECKPIQVRINGVNHASPENARADAPHDRHYGIYVQNEVLGGRFVETHFPNHQGGNLYHIGEDGAPWRHFPNSANLGEDYRATGWKKVNNSAADDWSDLHTFLETVTGTPGPESLRNIEEVLDLDAWLRTLAVATILTSGDLSLFTGAPANFALYQNADERFQLIAPTFQSVLGQGHEDDLITIEDLPASVFPFLDNDELADGPLQALFNHQEVVVRYLKILTDLLHGPLRENRINALVDDALSWTPPLRAEAAKVFFSTRRNEILTQIHQPLTIDSDLSTKDGYHHTVTDRVTLHGSFDATSTAALLVNGLPAEIDRRLSEWSLPDLSLFPGLNRITIEELTAEGDLLRESHLDVHYDDGDLQSTGGLLSEDTTLTVAGGPWRVTSDLVVPNGKTLTIEPGTSLYFTGGTGITVRPGGSVQALGERYQPIRFSREPGQSGRWDGLRLNAPSGQESVSPNLLRYVIMEYGDRQGEAISVQRSQLTLEWVTWDHTEQPVLDIISPQLLVENCHFPVISNAEVIRGRTLEDDDYFILRGNTFSASGHHQDIVRFANSHRPGPILAAYDNIFLGSADDCFDLDDTDAHLEGNIFKNVHLDIPRVSTSNAIVANNDSHLIVVRNLFHDVDHALLLKNGADCVFEHNTIVDATIAAISFDEPERGNIVPGKRIDLDSNIFLDCASTFAHESSSAPEPDPVILGHRNILPTEHHDIGSDNLDRDPFLLDQDSGPCPKSNWSLEAGSPAQGTGRNGNDRGALIPPGAIASNIPVAPIQSPPSYVFPVRGPGLTAYRWRLVTDGVPGEWSHDQFPGTPIRLSRLAPGTYSIDLLAKDSANHWQNQLTSSPTWQVTLNINGSLVLNEVAAVSSPGTDGVELYNGSSTPINLSGWFLTDNPLKPTKVPLAGFIGPGRYLFFTGRSAPKLGAKGDALYLFQGGRLVDSISWGLQVEGYTIGRDVDGQWILTKPTLGDPNQRAGVAPVRHLRINEWLATADLHYDKEFVEIYNPSDAPAPLHGLWISDSPDRPLRHPLPALSFIAAGGHAVYHPTSDLTLEADQLPFSLNGFYEAIVLSNSQGHPIDQVPLSSLHADVVEGRNPDGSNHIQSFNLGTPGRSNDRQLHHNVSTPLVPFLSQGWHYLDRGLPGAGWDTMKSFDLSNWEEGPAPIGRETSSLPYPLATNPNTIPDFDYVRGRKNYYFRRTFEFSGDPVDTFLTLDTYLDDGAIFYLNGHELYRHNVPTGPITSSTWALETIENAVREGPFDVPNDHLINGTNVLTIVTFQATENSSDVVMDCELTAIHSVPAPPDPEEVAMQTLMNYLRITEVMYNPPDGQDAEFIEIQNTSATLTLDITGVRLDDAVSFTFPEFSLRPGERVVVVNNTGQFQVVHGRGINIAGEFEGRLGNNSEVIALELPEPWDVSIHRFAYQSEWFAQTNSFGRSLEISDPNLPLSDWNSPFAWSESFRLHGTPGTENSSSDFQAWIEALGGEPGDRDRDGLPDLFEYAFDFDPDEPDFQAILSRVSESSNGLSATFLVPAVAPADAVFHLQSSPDMKNWITHASRFGNESWVGPTSVQASTPETGLGLVTIHFPMVAPKLYTRMVIEIQSSLPLAGP